jgi:hypothetical protein
MGQAGIEKGIWVGYGGHRPLLYMLSVLATMLSKRCVMRSKHNPQTPFFHTRSPLQSMLPMCCSVCVCEGGIKL